MDADLLAATREAQILSQRLVLAQREVSALDDALEASQGQIDALQTERGRLVQQWEEENRLRLICENQPNVTEVIAWGLSGIFAVATLVLGIILGITL